MADARPFAVYDSAGAPVTGAAAGMSALAWDIAGASRTPPSVVELGNGLYQVTPTDADETAGTLVLVDTGAGNEPRRVAIACFEADRSNQFLGWHLEDSAGDLWTGAAPTFGAWDDAAGTPRTPPTVVTVSAGVYVAVPTSADVEADCAGRIDSPAGAAPPYLSVATEPVAGSDADVSYSPGIAPEALAVKALRDYLLRYLPAKVAALNALRAASLTSALAGPYTVPSGAKLYLSATGQEATPAEVTLTAGTRTAAQVAADITAAAIPGLTAAADDWGRLTLTATAAPAVGAPSVVIVARDQGTGANVVFGWAEAGEHSETPALVAPSWRGVTDGRPLAVPDMGQGFWVMLGNRSVRPTHPGPRRDTFNVTIATELWRPFSANAPPHRTREAISACVRAVRELLLSTDGRYLGRQGSGDVQLADVADVSISGDPLRLNEAPGILFDVAQMTLTVRVFQRPDEAP